MTVTFTTDTDSLVLTHTTNFIATHVSNVPIPSWANASATLQDQIFSKSKEVLTYDARMTDADLAKFISFMALHELITFNDTDYLAVEGSQYCWIQNWSAQYDGNTNAIRPWNVSLEVIIIGAVP